MKIPITKALRKHKSVWQLLSPSAPRLRSTTCCTHCCLLSLHFTLCLQVTCSCPDLSDFAASQELPSPPAVLVALVVAKQERQRFRHLFTPYSGHNFKASLWFCVGEMYSKRSQTWVFSANLPVFRDAEPRMGIPEIRRGSLLLPKGLPLAPRMEKQTESLNGTPSGTV